MRAIGIDLAGKEENPTGLAFLGGKRVVTETLHSGGELLDACKNYDPDIVAVDAPLSFPDDWLRKADSDLIERGYRVLPPKLGGMECLTRRGISLSKKLEDAGLEVIEVHPLTSARILFGSKEMEDWIEKLSERGLETGQDLNEHEADALVAALTGLLHLQGWTEEVGEGDETVVIPLNQKEIL